MYVGFEIEVESYKKGHIYPILDLIEKAYPITGWSKHQGISTYHSCKSLSQYGLWRVEDDASLASGAEFVMPPVNKNVSFDLLEKFFKLIEDSDCYTSKRCGLHLNISNNSYTISNIDLGYFITNVNYRLLAKLWPDRVKQYNIYSVGLKHILSDMVRNKSLNINLNQQKIFQRKLLNNHNYMINVRFNKTKTIRERFEIRAMGGKNYHKKLEEIKITTNMFEDLLKKSCKPVQNTNRKIISYINRIHEKKNLNIDIWVPKIDIILNSGVNNKIIHELNSIKNIHKYGPQKFLEKINIHYNKFAYRKFHNKSLDTYFILMLQTVNSVISNNIKQLGLQSNAPLNNKIIRLTNEAIYHIVKCISNHPTVFSSKMCNKIIKKYMTGFTVLTNEKLIDLKIILTIPENEKQCDILWLSKHMYIFNIDTRQKYINKLSIHAINFINKHKEKYGKGILRMSQKRKKKLTSSVCL